MEIRRIYRNIPVTNFNMPPRYPSTTGIRINESVPVLCYVIIIAETCRSTLHSINYLTSILNRFNLKIGMIIVIHHIFIGSLPYFR